MAFILGFSNGEAYKQKHFLDDYHPILWLGPDADISKADLSTIEGILKGQGLIINVDIAWERDGVHLSRAHIYDGTISNWRFPEASLR